MSEELYSTDKSAPNDRATAGPFDQSEVNEVRPFIDLGSLRISPRENMQMKIEIEDATQRVIAVSIDYQGSSLQLQAFAAPRSSGLWHEIRREIQASLDSQGGETELRVGSLGPELVAKMPIKSDSGAPAGFRLAKFVGVDGPLWFLRGVIAGAALNNPKAAADIDDIFRSVVVVRDNVPLPPRDLLTLVVPGGTVAPPRSI
jgi:hypothetical protein